MNVFDILGPVMVGPSSSHTAGAIRIGQITRKLLGEQPMKAVIGLHGSFADTGVGHGTHKALVAGLLGMETDDQRIPTSDVIAREVGMEVKIRPIMIPGAHPNTALLEVYGQDGHALKVQASSLGGGRIMVNRLDDIDVNFTGEMPTLIVHNQDQPGHVAKVTSALAQKNLNIASMQLYRDKRGGYAVMVIEMDETVPKEALTWLSRLDGIIKVTYCH